MLLAAGLAPDPASAEWSGVRAYLSENDVDWNFENGKREASVSEFSFRIEEKLDGETRLGFGLGYLQVRLRGGDDVETRGFDAQYLELFLRQPIAIGDRFELSTQFNYRYNTGNDSDEDDPADIDWSEAGLEVGLGIRLTRVRVTPYAAYHYINGDIDADSGTATFDLDDKISSGVRLDLYVEDTAYVGVAVETGDYSRVYFTFAREY